MSAADLPPIPKDSPFAAAPLPCKTPAVTPADPSSFSFALKAAPAAKVGLDLAAPVVAAETDVNVAPYADTKLGDSRKIGRARRGRKGAEDDEACEDHEDERSRENELPGQGITTATFDASKFDLSSFAANLPPAGTLTTGKSD